MKVSDVCGLYCPPCWRGSINVPLLTVVHGPFACSLTETVYPLVPLDKKLLPCQKCTINHYYLSLPAPLHEFRRTNLETEVLHPRLYVKYAGAVRSFPTQLALLFVLSVLVSAREAENLDVSKFRGSDSTIGLASQLCSVM